jgi:hypothetical protein
MQGKPRPAAPRRTSPATFGRRSPSGDRPTAKPGAWLPQQLLTLPRDYFSPFAFRQ